MSKKLFYIMSLLLMAALVLAACGGDGAAEEDCASEDVLCIGFVTDVGEVDDGSCSASWRRAWRPG